MTDDLLTRLRRAKNSTLPVGALWRLCDEAADEIEWLRKHLRAEWLRKRLRTEKEVSDEVTEGYGKVLAELDDLREAIRLNDALIRSGLASYRGAEFARTPSGTIKIAGPENYTGEAGSILSAMREVDDRLTECPVDDGFDLD